MNGNAIQVSPLLLYTLAVMAVAFAAGVIYNISTNKQLQFLIKRYKSMLQRAGSIDIDAVVDHLAARVEKVETKLDSIHQAYALMAEDELSHVRTVSIVRFNAFEGQGGDQSFSLALLDARKNGVVITSLAGSKENRIYAKPVKAGNSEIALTVEEEKVLKEASERR